MLSRSASCRVARPMRSEAPSRPRHGIATILQDLQSDLSGQRLARCDHAVAGTSGRKNCPERTGLLLGTERHWSDCGERQNGGTSFAAPIVAGIQALINPPTKLSLAIFHRRQGTRYRFQRFALGCHAPDHLDNGGQDHKRRTQQIAAENVGTRAGCNQAAK
jgi:hypothetical protein